MDLNWTEIIKAGILSLPGVLSAVLALLAYLQGKKNHGLLNGLTQKRVEAAEDTGKLKGKVEAMTSEKAHRDDADRRGR